LVRKDGAVKPKVYIETSIVSYLVARPSTDLRVAANQVTTLEWWERRRPEFELYVSQLVLAEAEMGDADAARRRLAALEGIPVLVASMEAEALGDALVTDRVVAAAARVDAYHIALAATHGMDYLLTWNCTHIANATKRLPIEACCRARGLEPPAICTPQELMEAPT
jgi:hypothetical protein